MCKTDTLVRLCGQLPLDLAAVERHIVTEALTPREVTLAAYRLAERYQDEVAVFRYECGRAPTPAELVTNGFSVLLPLLVRYGLDETLTVMSSDGGERYLVLLVLLDWLDNRTAGEETARLLVAGGFDPHPVLEDGTRFVPRG